MALKDELMGITPDKAHRAPLAMEKLTSVEFSIDGGMSTEGTTYRERYAGLFALAEALISDLEVYETPESMEDIAMGVIATVWILIEFAEVDNLPSIG